MIADTAVNTVTGAAAAALDTTSSKPKRPPIRRSNRGVETVDPTANILDRPMITENRYERRTRQEKFRWLLRAWSE